MVSEKRKKGLISKFIDFSVEILDAIVTDPSKDPFEAIQNADIRYDEGRITTEQFENIKKENIKLIIKNLSDENFFTNINKAKNLMDIKTLSKLDFNEIKNFSINKFLNDEVLYNEEIISSAKKFKILIDDNILTELDYERIKSKYMTKLTYDNYLKLNYFNELNKIKFLEKLSFINTIEYDKLKGSLISKFMNDKILQDPLGSIKQFNSLFIENILNKEDYLRIKRKCITENNNTPILTSLKVLEIEQNKLNKLMKLGAITEIEHLEITNIFIDIVFIDISKKLGYEKSSLLNSVKIKEIYIDKINSGGIAFLNIFELLNRMKYLEKLNALTTVEYEEIKRIFIIKFSNSYEILINDELTVIIEKINLLYDEKVLNEEDYEELSNVIKNVYNLIENREFERKMKAIYQIKNKINQNKAQIQKQITTMEDNIIINNFAKKYSDFYSDNEFHKLKELLEFEGYKIHDSSLKSLITESIKKHNYQNFEYNSIINNFAKKYSDFYSDEDFHKLKELLEFEGYKIHDSSLKSLITEYDKKLKYKIFEKKLLHNLPENLDQFILNFVEIYGVNYLNEIENFKTLIQTYGHDISEKKLISKINEKIKEKKLMNFKRDLLNNEGLSISDIDKFTGFEFEIFAKILFEKMGYDTYKTKQSGDQGADLILNKFGEVTVVQAKRHNNKITNKAIQEVTASISYYNAHKGIVITNNEFTISAIELANSNNIKLIPRLNLNELIHNYPINKNYLKKYMNENTV